MSERPIPPVSEILADRVGEELALNDRYLNPQVGRVLRTLGFDRSWSGGEGAHLIDSAGERYLDLMNVQHGWQKTLDRYSVDTIVIAPKFALTQTLKISRDWRVVYDDGIALVFRRNPPEPASFATSNEGNYPWSRDHGTTNSKPPGAIRGIAQPTT